MTLTQNPNGLQELASGSLPTLGGDPLQPSWSRSLPELMAANQALIGNTGAVPPQPTAAAQVLLGSTRTDFGSLAASLETPKATVSQTASFLSAEERCRQHRDGIIEGILKKQREQTHRILEKSIDRQLEDDWAKERSLWMEELVGKRNLAGSSNPRLALGPSQSTSLVALPGPMSSNLLPGYASTSSQYLDVKIASDHAQLVQSLSVSSSLSEVLARFQHVASTVESNAGYTTAWQLFQSTIPNLTSPINGALGSLVHLCKQYQSFVKNRVASASLAGQDVSTTQNYGSGMAGTVAAYVKLDYGSNASIWHLLYFCLRCGDAAAARDILSVGSAGQQHFSEHPLLRNVLSDLAQRQGNASCLWETGNPMIASRDIATMVDLYEKTINLEPNNTYKIAVLALLSGNDMASFSTIEDYLFGRLWLALQSENPPNEINQIGASIRKYGPEYFGGAEENGGWGYALPLLVSQQFKTALTFLAEAGGTPGLIQATHLGLILSMNRIPVEDLGRPSTGDLVTALLVKYATTLEMNPSLGVGGALEYIIRIPQKELSRKEIASFLCRSPHLIDQLAGTMQDDGTRQRGELDKHLSRDEVALVLAQAAENSRGHLNDRFKAEFALKLYMLSGQYSALVSMLNELITPVEKDDDNKRYWWEQSQNFHSYYLAKRSLALASLESENNLGLVSTNRSLMELRNFFLTLRNENYQEALEMVIRTHLLPFAQEEVNEKESRYKDLDPSLKKEFPALVSGAVHCLHGMHRKIKSQARGVDASVDFHLKDLQKKARFLYIFSGLTKMPSSTKEDIQRLRNNMM